VYVRSPHVRDALFRTLLIRGTHDRARCVQGRIVGDVAGLFDSNKNAILSDRVSVWLLFEIY
jgi:hypothetical protein